MKNLSLLSELLESSSTACELFIKSEIALNDGEIEICQKFSKEGQQLLKTLISDTFIEFNEFYGLDVQECLDYDYPNNMELIKFLTILSKFIGGLIGSNDEKIEIMYAKNVIKSINTVKEIYIALYEN